jgi:hypothetical protein
MKTSKLTIALITLSIVAACSSSKKSTTSVSPPVSSTNVNTTAIPAGPVMVARSTDGIYAPGDLELTAIQTQYKNVTLEKLKEGHQLYAEGACVNCHKAQSIYKYSETQWQPIIERMAYKARMTEAQKDAVYKYVLAIKATQPK